MPLGCKAFAAYLGSEQENWSNTIQCTYGTKARAISKRDTD